MENAQYVFYKDREEWRDVIPIKQDEKERTVAKINYSEKFIDVYDYIRAVMLKDERSERALQLTEDALILNAANYSVWYYRRNILSDLKSNLNDELNFVAMCINENQKNYQVWYHRQWIVAELTKTTNTLRSIIENELILTESFLLDDSKNYHVWQYRHWIVNSYKMWDNELAFTDKMLVQDCFNNSAWNHRFYVIQSLSGFTDVVIDQETQYVFKFIRLSPENESSWNYLDGLYRNRELRAHSNLGEFCRELQQSDCASSSSPYLHSFALEICLSKLRHADRPGDDGAREQLVKEAVDTCNLLADKLDRIRVNYWKYRLHRIAVEFGSEQATAAAAEAAPTQ